ncbi:MAG: tetratricopeptide repeat protein [Deltaproteobacteria bacterium]|nr:tetratricopeptide repeat protein [Deltaproteobacteria bacterium]
MKRKFFGSLAVMALLAGLTACGPTLAQKKEQSGIHYRLGAVHLNDRNLADALNELTKAIEIYPDNPTYHDALGLAYLAKGMHKEALASMNKALSIDRNYSEAHVNKAAVYMDQQRWAEAIDESKAAVKNIFYRTPEFAWFNMGWSYYNMGEMEKAVESYSKAVGANPSYAQAWYGMGVAYDKLNRTKDAVASYNRAVAVFPGYLDAYFNMGMALVKAKDKAGAVKAFEKVIELAPASEKAQSARDYIGLIK